MNYVITDDAGHGSRMLSPIQRKDFFELDMMPTNCLANRQCDFRKCSDFS